MRTGLLLVASCKIEDDFALIVLIARPRDVVFVDEAVALDADALDNRQFVAFVIPQRLLDESVTIPVLKAGRSRTFRRIIATTTTKSGSRAGFQSLPHFEPPHFHPLPHFLKIRWRSWRPHLQV